jgi:hypothetical protein
MIRAECLKRESILVRRRMIEPSARRLPAAISSINCGDRSNYQRQIQAVAPIRSPGPHGTDR